MGSGVIVLDGNVSIRAESLDKNVTLSSVPISGSTSSLDMGVAAGKILSTRILKTAGDASIVDITIYDSSSADDQHVIFEATMSSGTSKALVNEILPFRTSDNKLYVKIVPASGTGHDFYVRVQAEAMKAI